MRFSRTLNVPKYDLPGYSKSLEKALGELLRASGREWLRSILADNVPVHTGMAKATLQPLARFLGRVPFDIIPIKAPYTNTKAKQEELRYRVSITEGLKKQSFKIIDDRSDPGKMQFHFFWENEVLHYWYAEYYKFSPAGEILVAKANNVFVEHMNEGMARRLPQYAQHMRVRAPGSSSEVPF